MKSKGVVMGILAVMVLVFTSCASYTPTLVKVDPSGPSVAKEAKGDLCIYLEEYATKEKCEKAFDTNLSKEGVLALLIQVQNNGQNPYEVKASSMIVREGDKWLKALTPEEAAGKAKRSAVGRAIGWSLIVPIIAIPVAAVASATHTSKVNKQIIQDFAAKAFVDGTLMPAKEQSGFLFFELEKGRKDLSGLSLELAARNEVSGELVTITTPLPEATFKAVKQEESEEEQQPMQEYSPK